MSSGTEQRPIEATASADRAASESAPGRRQRKKLRFSISGLLTWLLVIALISAYGVTVTRLRSAESELARLRSETGYLEPSGNDEIAAIRLMSEQPMQYRLRVRVPESPPYRVAYSSFWPESSTSPEWYGAVKVPPGESIVLVSILKDPRDDRWKIAAVQPGPEGTRRMATTLPRDQVDVFRQSNDWLRSGVPYESIVRPKGEKLRLLDERVLLGEGAMMLYGDRPPEEDLIGVFAELQPDTGPL